MLALLLLAALGLGPTAGGPTSLHVYRFFAHGNPTVAASHVRTLGEGYCLHGTPADGRADAWYCDSTTVRQGVEPCFSAVGIPYVLCDPSGPPGPLRAVWRLRLTRPLPTARANPARSPTAGRPMIVRLASGAYCWVPTGTGELANGTIRGLPVTYGCDPARSTPHALVQLVGNPAHAGRQWTILAVSRSFGPQPLHDNRSRLARVPIAAAWW